MRLHFHSFLLLTSFCVLDCCCKGDLILKPSFKEFSIKEFVGESSGQNHITFNFQHGRQRRCGTQTTEEAVEM